MNHNDEEMLKFGRMVFGMITDTLVLAANGDCSYGSRSVTIKGNHRCRVFVVTGDELAEAFEETARRVCVVTEVPTKGEDGKFQ